MRILIIEDQPDILQNIADYLELKGYLVDVDHDSGWMWRTSMSRTDSGDGACEIVYVESLSVENPG